MIWRTLLAAGAVLGQKLRGGDAAEEKRFIPCVTEMFLAQITLISLATCRRPCRTDRRATRAYAAFRG